MWQKHDDERTLWMDITARDRTFVISLFGYGTGILAKEPQVLDEATFDNLRKTLDLLTSRHHAPTPEAFHDFGGLLFELVIPEPIQDFLLQHNGPLVFATPELTLPWELLCIEQKFLCLKQPLSRQLRSLNKLKSALFPADKIVVPASDAAALIIANPTGDLPSAAEEAEEIYSILTARGLHVDLLIGPKECTYQRIMAQHVRRRPYEIIHFSGHARYIPEKETSGIPLADGGLLLAQDIQKTFKGEPLVFLNACWSAMDGSSSYQGPGYCGTNVVRTLTEAFTVGNRSGRVRAVIGSLWWIADNIACGLAGHFYREVLAGRTIGDALKEARVRASQDQDGADPALWSTYALFGEAGLRWSPGPAPASSVRTAAGPEKTDASGPRTDFIPDPPPAPAGDALPPPPAEDVAGPVGENLDSNAEPGPAKIDAESGELPWSDDVRMTFVGALAVMAATRWHSFCTIHLVLGLTYLEKGLVSTALKQNGHDPDVARRKLREGLVVDHSHEETEDFVISDNVLSVLNSARRSAKHRGALEVTEAHLLLGMLDVTGSGGSLLLKALDVDLDQLRQTVLISLGAGGCQDEIRPSGDIMLPNGALNQGLFEADAWSACEEAALMAYRSHWAELRSPHLFLGILNRRGSKLAKHLAAVLTIEANQLATTLLVALARNPDASLRPPKLNREFLSENALLVLRKAHELAQRRQAPQIKERDLLEAIVTIPSNIITLSLRQSGIDPSKLLW